MKNTSLRSDGFLTGCTIAAVLVMVIVEHYWMKPRATEKWRYGYRPPPPREYQAPVARFLRDLRDTVQK